MITTRRLARVGGLRSVLLRQQGLGIRASQRCLIPSATTVRFSSNNSGNGGNNGDKDGPSKSRTSQKPVDSSKKQDGSRSEDSKTPSSATKSDRKNADQSSNSSKTSTPDASANGEEDGGQRGGRRRPIRRNDDDKPKSVSVGKNTGDSTSSNGDSNNNKGPHFGFRPASPEDKKQVLSLLVPDRPAIPGYHRACRIHDPEIIYAVRRIFYDNLEDQCIAIFMKRPDSNEKTEVLKDVNDAYPVGAYCRIGGVFSRYEDGQPGCTLTLLPLSRIEAGDLVEQNEPERSKDDKNTNMDVTSFDTAYNDADLYSLKVPWMKNIKVVDHEPFDVHDKDVQALCAEILEELRKLSSMSPIFREQIASFAIISLKPTNESVGDPAALADFTAAMCEGSSEVQEILETRDIKTRLEKSLELVKREAMQISLQEKFKKSVDAKLQNRYKKVYLEEKMSEIKKELGYEGKEKNTNVFRERAAKLNMPPHVQKAFEEEMNKLESTDPSSTEHSMVRNYVDWLTNMPWGIYSEDKYDIKEARKVLDEGHYGLKDVKDRILEFIATARLSGTVEGKIICFCGPPGVGKTSIGKSIAESLGRKFSRISVGGMNDVTEIKGHRRTYVGAVPGRVIQTLKQTKTQNPLILIDEIDKVGRVSMQGDPSAALLELLDPEQNSSFVDTYLDLPMDVSKVLFVCTANYMENIPPPLKDRMEIVDISGYVASERVAIAQQYLVPASKKASGLSDISVNIAKEAIEKLASLYSRENGVRGLKKLIEKIHRKVSLKVVENYDTGESIDAPVEEANARTTEEQEPKGEPEPKYAAAASENSGTVETESQYDPKSMGGVDISEADAKSAAEAAAVKKIAKLDIPEGVEFNINSDGLTEYVGPPVHVEKRMYEETPAGVVMGLAYTEMGGVPLYVESALQQPLSVSTKPEFNRTGQLGDVMNESSSIAYSFCRMFMTKNFPQNQFFDKAVIHLHCPEGAVKKDGPSAGVTMTTSLLSLALDHKVDAAACMTGELTLNGKVLRIGGLKEKVMAAKLAGANKIFFPYDNTADWENMPEFIREGLTPIPVRWYQEIFDQMFDGLDKSRAQTLWKDELAKNKSE